MLFMQSARNRRWLSVLLCAALALQLISLAVPAKRVQASQATSVTEESEIAFVLPKADIAIHVIGSFNEWGNNTSVTQGVHESEDSPGTYTIEVENLIPGQEYEFKYVVYGSVQNDANLLQAADADGVLRITKALRFYAAGSFDGWSNPRQLTLEGEYWTFVTPELAPGTYQYKYVMKTDNAGDTYFFDPTNPAQADGNNVITVPAPVSGEPAANVLPVAYESVTEQPGGLNWWYVTGSFQGWNNSNEATRMKHLVGGFYMLSLDLAAGSHEFKFTKNGTWDGYSDGGDNITFSLIEPCKVYFYVNDEINQVRISLPGVAGVSQYVPAISDANWPRLVGTVQPVFGEPEWSPEHAEQYLVDYNFDGSVYKVQRSFPAGSYDAKVTFGGDWGENYGATGPGGDNLVLKALDPADVTFTLDYTGDKNLKHDYKPMEGGTDGLIQGAKLYYDSRSVTYKKPFGAIPMGEQDVTLRIAAEKDDVVLARAEMINPEGIATAYDMRKITTLGDKDYFETVIPKSAFNKIGIWGYKFIVIDGSTKMEYGDDQMRGSVGQAVEEGALPFDLTVYAPDFKTPNWMKNAIVYQIFPDRFFDGDESNNRAKLTDGYRGIRNDAAPGGEIGRHPLQYFDGGVADEPAADQVWGDWSDVPENPDRLKPENKPYYPDAETDGVWTNEFYGGDIKGIEQKLDYLQSIGVTTIYLNPVAWAASNHKYDATDYKHLDPMFGAPVYNVPGDPSSGLNYEETRRASDKVYSDFAKAARERGIKLLNDGVFNHVGDDSIYFDRYEKYPEIGAYEYWAKVWHKVNEEGKTQEQAEAEVRAFYTSQINPATGVNYKYPGDFEFTTWFTIENTKVADRDNTASIFKYDAWWGYDSLPAMDAKAPQEGDDEALSGLHEWNNTSYRSHVIGEDLTGKTEAEQQELMKHTVSQRWEWLGASGWRLDVAPDVSSGTWQKFRESVKSVEGLTDVNGSPIDEPLILGEEWGVATRFLLGDQFDSVMNYRFRGALQSFLTGGSAEAMNESLESIREDYPKEAWQVMLNLIGSHDTSRSITKLEYPEWEEEHLVIAPEASEEALKKQALTAIFQMGYPGAPTIYYGDEVGVAGTKDPDSRRTFPWERVTETNGAFASTGRYAELFDIYQKAAAIRNNNAVFRTGDVFNAYARNDVIAYARKDASKAGLVAINRSEEDQTISADVTGFLPDGLTLRDLLGGSAAATVSGGKIELTVPAMTGLMMLSDGSFTSVPEVTGLHAAGGNGNVDLSWNPVAGAEGYAVYRAPIEGGALIKLDDVAGTSYRDEAVMNGTKYYYAVTAVIGTSESLLGDMAAATPAFPIDQVGLPAGVAPVTLGVGHSTEDITVSISVKGLTDNAAYAGAAVPGLNARLFYYKEGTDPAFAFDTKLRFKEDVAGGEKIYYAAFEPTEAGKYRYYAKVSTDNGETWTVSGEQTLSVNPDPSDTTPPETPVLAEILEESNRVELVWFAEGFDIVGFEIYRKSAAESAFRKIAVVSKDIYSYVDYAVSNDTEYTYTVAAYDSAYNRAHSAEQAITPKLVMVDVTLRVYLPDYTPATEDIYIAGSFNGWNASGNKLNVPSGATSRDVVEYSFKMMAGKQIEYKFTRGSWSSEAFTSHARISNDTEDYGNWAYSSTDTNMKLTVKNMGGNKMTVNDYVLRWVDMPMMISMPRKSFGEDIAYTTADSSFKLVANVPYGVAFTINGTPIADEDMDAFGKVEVESIPLKPGLNTFELHIEPTEETLSLPWYTDTGRAGQATKTITLNITREGATPTPSSRPASNPAPSVEPTPSTSPSEKPPSVSGPAAEVEKVLGEDGKPVVTVKLDSDKLGEALGLLKDKPAAEQRVVVVVEDDAAAQMILTATGLADAANHAPEAVLSFRSNSASYDLPLGAVDTEELAKRLGADVKDILIAVNMEPASEERTRTIRELASQSGAHVLAPAVEFSVTAEAGGKSVSITGFGGYVSRTIVLPDNADIERATGVVLNEETDELTFVPTAFKVVDGKLQAVLKRPGNSVYTVVSFKKSFADLGGHWAKETVEQLASKMIVQGQTVDSFGPEEKVTRAQFAALLTRSLGLKETAGSQEAFTDVNAGQWFAGAVGSAIQAKLVEGYDDGSFRPYASITRQEMAVMIARAAAFAGKPAAETVHPAAKFTDHAAISDWADESVALCVSTGILQGKGEDVLAPEDLATRAEATAMLQRLLIVVGFIE